MQTTLTKIDIPYPEAAALSLLLRLGPCRVRLTQADDAAWVTGTYDDPTGVMPLDVRSEAGSAAIAQRFDLGRGFDVASLPRLDLRVGRTRPFALAIEAGASENAFDLGGLPLTALTVKAGAGKYDIDFSAPNPAALTLIDLAAGAGAISARHLGNANFAELRLGGGVGRCVLDFSGELRRDARARVDAGLAAVEIEVPAATAARVNVKAVAAQKDVVGPLTQQGDALYTKTGLEGTTPQLLVDVSIAFGSVLVRAT